MEPRKTQPGMPFSFSASFYNDLVDTVRWAKTQRNLGGSGQRGGASNEVRLMVKNTSGNLVPRFGCLEVAGKVGSTEDFANLKVLSANTPSTPIGPVVILQEAAAANEIAEAVVAGVTIASVNVSSTSHKYAEPSNSSTNLVSAATGRFTIMHPLTSTGVQLVLVRYEATSTSEVKLVKAPSGGIPGRVGTLLGSATCDVWNEAANGQIQDSGEDILVDNWSKSAVCKTGDRYGIAAQCNGGWYIVAEDCNDTGSTIGGGTGTSSGGTIVAAIDTSTTTPASITGIGGEVRFRQGTTGSMGSGSF